MEFTRASFRPRFRLSLLFVVIALVAGVSVCWRQAIVRDQYIKQLLAEPHVSGHPDSVTTYWYTKLFNKLPGERYYDNIGGLHIMVHKLKLADFLRKFQNAALDLKIRQIDFQAIDAKDDQPRQLGEDWNRRPIPLSTLFVLLDLFPEIQFINISYAEIIDDVTEYRVLDCHCERLTISNCKLETQTLHKLMKKLNTSPQKINMYHNHLRGSDTDLLNIGFTKFQFGVDLNWFTEKE